MEENREQEVKPAYKPRPMWQIVMAWIGVAIMVVSIALYYIQIAKGGIG
jgi:hypothetical protein